MKDYKIHKINFGKCPKLKEIKIETVEIILKIKKRKKIEEYKVVMQQYLPKRYEVKIKKYLKVQDIFYLVNNKIKVYEKDFIKNKDYLEKKSKFFNLEKDNRVVILATMSSGKSTLLNALIGKEILPSENQACTGKIFEIFNGKSKFEKVKIFRDGKISEEKFLKECNLKELNTREKIVEIKINTKFMNIKRKIKLYDTPGVNNSIDSNHKKLTYNFLKETKVENYIYILNATQIGVLDDYRFLMDLKEMLDQNKENYKILFLLNKIDFIDNEKENLGKIIQNVKEYLQKIGFENSNLIPISAYKASILRRGLHEDLKTRIEKREYLNILNEYIERKKITEYVEKELVEEIINETGIKEVENLLK